MVPEPGRVKEPVPLAGGVTARIVRDIDGHLWNAMFPKNVIVLGRFTTVRTEQYSKVDAPIVVIPSGTVIPVNFEDLISGVVLEDSPVKYANSWNVLVIAELVNLSVPKAQIPWGISSKQIASAEE